MSHFHEEQIRSSQAVHTDSGHEWRLESRASFVAAVLVESSVRLEEQIRNSQAVGMDGGHEWRLASRKLSSFCCCCSYWMLEISIPYAIKSNGGHEWRSY